VRVAVQNVIVLRWGNEVGLFAFQIESVTVFTNRPSFVTTCMSGFAGLTSVVSVDAFENCLQLDEPS
jgi:hypothetical protein